LYIFGRATGNWYWIYFLYVLAGYRHWNGILCSGVGSSYDFYFQVPMTDDNEPITREWLSQVGFKPVESDMGPHYNEHYDFDHRTINIWEFNDTGVWLLNDCDRIELKTRRHVRMLAELLNARLEECRKIIQ
jgi:hypothetical protein